MRLQNYLNEAKAIKVSIESWKGTNYDSEYKKGDTGSFQKTKEGFEYKPMTGQAKDSYSDGVIKVVVDDVETSGKKITASGNGKKFTFKIK